MCDHKKIKKSDKEVFRKFGKAFKIYDIWICDCGHIEERFTGLIAYGKDSKYNKFDRFKLNVI